MNRADNRPPEGKLMDGSSEPDLYKCRLLGRIMYAVSKIEGMSDAEKGQRLMTEVGRLFR